MNSIDPMAALTEGMTPKRAVIYLRVSTSEQATKGGQSEGFSIPAQREANKKKAQSLGAIVVKEFVERGVSGTSTNRPALKAMLRYLEEENGAVDYVVVHKIDRLARNRADDVAITAKLDEYGARLVSTSENIDQTPGGLLMHGIMSSIAEFYSKNLANEVVKGMSQKARSGGTIGKAPIGYLNVRKVINGVESRTVDIDPERAPLVRWAFEEYAKGETSMAQLAEELNDRGLTTVPTRKLPARPITKRYISQMLPETVLHRDGEPPRCRVPRQPRPTNLTGALREGAASHARPAARRAPAQASSLPEVHGVVRGLRLPAYAAAPDEPPGHRVRVLCLPRTTEQENDLPHARRSTGLAGEPDR